jgi:ATP-binding cassette subfamily F protein 3
MLRAEDLQFKRGDEVLFEALTFVVHPGQRVALAGRNGVGKSTLFQMIMGELLPDQGELTMPAGWTVGYMEQEAEVTERPALEYVVDGHSELRRVEKTLRSTQDDDLLAQLHVDLQDLGGYEARSRAGEILSGLGFAANEFDKPYAAFSGGWRIRLNLAQALMTPCDLLLLDEPTNHLDLEAIMWLEGWLSRFAGTVIVIAHDRAFLDACAGHTLYLANQSGQLYSGNYSACERQRAERLEQEQAMRGKREAQAAHIQKFVDRFRAKASKAKQVQSRIKALERLQLSAALQVDSPYAVSFTDPDKVSNPLFSLRDVSLGYGETVVLENMGQSILPGARIGVLGANGAGKSTLLKALVGDLIPLCGELTKGQHCEVGYFAQHQLETLDASKRALTMFQDLRPAWREQQCRDYLGRWGFDAGMIKRPIRTLSGGEKARLVLAIIALEKPAILILDEPTNHLDLDMRDALALALQDYTGAVIIVSHDRFMLDKTVDDFWVLENRQLLPYTGDLVQYTTARKTALAAASTTDDMPSSRKTMRQDRARQRASMKHLRDTARKLERDMEKQTLELQSLEQQLADTDTYQALPADELAALLARAGKLRVSLEQTEEAWLQATAALDQAMKDTSEIVS